MSGQRQTSNVDVAVLGAGIVGVSAAYAARQRGLSVILVDRREPGSETSYGNAGILSSGSILPLNQPSLFGMRCRNIWPTAIAALRWDPAGRCAIPTGSCAFWPMRRRRRPSRARLALHGLIGASLKLHREWIVQGRTPAQRIRETGWLKAWRSDAVAAAKADRPCWPNMASRASCSTARRSPRSSRTSCRSTRSACCTPQTASVEFAGRGGQGLCADVRGCRRRGPSVRRSSRSRPTATAGAWCWRRRDLGAPCRGRARAVVGGFVAAARLSRAARLRARLSSGVQAEPGAAIAASDP